MSHLAVIPARSGSKGLKDKNIMVLNGKPLMAYSIEAALESKIFDCVHVSTDSEYYAGIARKYGADVHFLRSKNTASDTAGSWEAVEEVLKKYELRNRYFDMVTLLQPTSPLRTAEDIVEAYEFYQKKSAKAVVSVCEMEHSPLWSNVLPENKSMEGFIGGDSIQQRQRIQKYYRINGAIYMVDCGFIKEDFNLYRKGCYAFVMKQDKSVDIDSKLDFDIAEYLCKVNLRNGQ